MTVKLLFLDIDGVLNHSNFLHDAAKLRIAARKEAVIVDPDAFHGAHQIDPEKVALLNEIVERTACRIVLSSSWRVLNTPEEMTAILRVHGFKGEIKDATPRTFQIVPGERWTCRGEEIKAWIGSAGLQGRTRFAILDDSNDMDDLGHALVRTSMEEGLLPGHVDAVVRRLNEKDD